MRFPVLTSLLVLAACGGPPVANEQQVARADHDGTARAPSLPPPNGADRAVLDDAGASAPNAEPRNLEPSPVLASDPASSIPASFQGRFAFDAAGCAKRGSEGQLVVEPGSLRFYESVGAATRVTPDGDNAVRVSASYSGEGQEWSATHRLALAGDRLTVTGEDGKAVRRVRCDS